MPEIDEANENLVKENKKLSILVASL